MKCEIRVQILTEMLLRSVDTNTCNIYLNRLCPPASRLMHDSASCVCHTKLTRTCDGGRVLDGSAHVLSRALVSQSASVACYTTCLCAPSGNIHAGQLQHTAKPLTSSFSVPVCAITASGVPGGKFVSVNHPVRVISPATGVESEGVNMTE
jgi:hypothetical protein